MRYRIAHEPERFAIGRHGRTVAHQSCNATHLLSLSLVAQDVNKYVVSTGQSTKAPPHSILNICVKPHRTNALSSNSTTLAQTINELYSLNRFAICSRINSTSELRNSSSKSPPPIAAKIKSRPLALAFRQTSSSRTSVPPRFNESSRCRTLI